MAATIVKWKDINGKTWDVGSYETTVVSESPRVIKVSGYYDVTHAPRKGDALHSYQSRKGNPSDDPSGFGGRMNDAVSAELKSFYNSKLNPDFTVSSSITGNKVTWSVEIKESTDGKAYVGIQSRGGAKGGGYAPWAITNTNDKKKGYPAELGEPNMEQVDVLDFKTVVGGTYIRQIFWKYTKPKANPPHPPSSSGTSGSAGTSGTSGTSGSAGTSGTSGVTETIPTVSTDTFITGKIKITKKSGPGELTGVTEIDLTDTGGTGTTNATFKGLQFTEGGDYVLSITCTSDSIEPTELKVKVLKEDDIVAQPDSKGSNTEQKAVDGSRPIIAQIDKPTIKVPPIVMKQDPTVGAGGQSDFTQGLGYTPLIWYKSFTIEERYITNLRLYHEGLIPKIEFTFEDTKDVLRGIGMPTDDSTIDLFLNSTSTNLKSLHIVFKIESFDQGREKAGQKFTIGGTMNIPNLYLVGNNSYNDTSFNTLRKICSELEIGFNSNISNTEDKMPWKNTQKKIYDFMSDIVARSYIGDESFMGGYIDYYYCFNYVDIEKEMNRDNSKDIGIDTSGVSQQSVPDETKRIMPLTLTNDKAQSTSSNYITDVIKVNDSTRKSLKHGYATVTKFYDRIKKQFLVFTVDSTTSDGSKSIILKGGKNDDKYQKEHVVHKFAGKIDTDNVHENFNYAATQNRINLDNLNKIAINATLPNANWNLYKFQKVNVQLINQSSTPANPSPVDFRYSGSYIIADIEYVWVNGKMSQRIRLVRKELGKTPDEIKNDPPVKKAPEVKENNFNPTGTSSVVPAPNEVYNVGQTYLVQDKNGKLYNITVTKLLEDGIQVTGTLTESPIGMSQSSASNTSPAGTNNATGTTTQGPTL